MENQNKTILIIEDDQDFIDILNKNFSGQGFSVVLARDGRAGLGMALDTKPDLILLDIMMPEMNGIEVAKKIKESGLKCAIIFLTNVKDMDSMSRALEVTESDYIVKSDMRVDDIVKRVKEKLGIKV